jgi:hypothetical protein
VNVVQMHRQNTSVGQECLRPRSRRRLFPFCHASAISARQSPSQSSWLNVPLGARSASSPDPSFFIRPLSMILWAYASPIPGRATSCSLVTKFRSIDSATAAFLSALNSDFFGSVLGASACETPNPAISRAQSSDSLQFVFCTRPLAPWKRGWSRLGVITLFSS